MNELDRFLSSRALCFALAVSGLLCIVVADESSALRLWDAFGAGYFLARALRP